MHSSELTSTALKAALAAARVAMSWRGRAAQLQVDEKSGPADLVSQADREAELAIRAVLAQRRPNDGVLGEEYGSTTGDSQVQWVVDPVDGTTSYLYGRSDWAVSVAAMSTVNGRVLAGVVVEPALSVVTQATVGGGTWVDERPLRVRSEADLSRALIEVNFGHALQREHAGSLVGGLLPRVRDLRRGGSAAAALAKVASGRADAAWIPGVRAWDGAAGVLLVQEAGGLVGDLNGPCDGVWPASGDVLAAGPALWEPLRTLLADVYGSGRPQS